MSSESVISPSIWTLGGSRKWRFIEPLKRPSGLLANKRIGIAAQSLEGGAVARILRVAHDEQRVAQQAAALGARQRRVLEALLEGGVVEPGHLFEVERRRAGRRKRPTRRGKAVPRTDFLAD